MFDAKPSPVASAVVFGDRLLFSIGLDYSGMNAILVYSLSGECWVGVWSGAGMACAGLMVGDLSTGWQLKMLGGDCTLQALSLPDGKVAVAVAALLGCASATPSSKSQTSKACGNTITVNLNLALATNALACAAIHGGVTISLSDLIGTQVQSADAGGNESVSQTATPSNTPGIVGDKPIETIGDVGKAALTSGTSTLLKQAANAAGLTGTAAATDKAVAPVTGSACADGSCAVK